jgi:hypothetical protein
MNPLLTINRNLLFKKTMRNFKNIILNRAKLFISKKILLVILYKINRITRICFTRLILKFNKLIHLGIKENKV